jgi:hypothetical protein
VPSTDWRFAAENAETLGFLERWKAGGISKGVR